MSSSIHNVVIHTAIQAVGHPHGWLQVEGVDSHGHQHLEQEVEVEVVVEDGKAQNPQAALEWVGSSPLLETLTHSQEGGSSSTPRSFRKLANSSMLS